MSRRWRIPPRRGQSWGPPPAFTQTVTQTLSIPSEESWGVGVVEDFAIHGVSIPSAESWGVGVVVTGQTTVTQTDSIGSAESWGVGLVVQTFDLATIRRPARRAEGYELVMVARIVQPSGPPTFVEVDDIRWEGLAYTDELSRPQSLQVSAPVERLTDALLDRMLDLRRFPSELWLYRDGALVFAGPLWTFQTQSGTATFNAFGLLGYLRYRYVQEDAVFTQVDQHLIVQALVDATQAREHGHVGIVTDNVVASGVLRDHTYKAAEGHQIGQRIEELGRRENGFDAAVDPVTRQLQLWYPQQGVDRSSGEDAVVFDGLSITSLDVAVSVAPGDIASTALGAGTGAEPLFDHVTDPEVAATFGAADVFESFDGVSESSTLTDHLAGLLAARSAPLLVPGPAMRVPPDVPLSAYGVGDTVQMRVHDLIGLEGAYRLRKRTVSVSSNGVEKVTVEFA